MPQLNDLSRSLVILEQDATLIPRSFAAPTTRRHCLPSSEAKLILTKLLEIGRQQQLLGVDDSAYSFTRELVELIQMALVRRCHLQHSAHRRFQAWCRGEVLRGVLTDIANELRERGVLDEEKCFTAATFVMAKGGGAEVGPTKRGKGMKIMAIVDRHGLPLSVSTHAARF